MKQTTSFWITLLVSIGLIVGGFFCPPMGEIDGSVLSATGLLLAFAVIAQIPVMIESASHIHMEKGDITIDIHSDEEAEDTNR